MIPQFSATEAPRLLRICALILFLAYLLTAFYAVNGMSEMPFIFFMAQATYCYLHWADTHHWSWTVYAALATAMMALVRYDAIFFAVALLRCAPSVADLDIG